MLQYLKIVVLQEYLQMMTAMSEGNDCPKWHMPTCRETAKAIKKDKKVEQNSRMLSLIYNFVEYW